MATKRKKQSGYRQNSTRKKTEDCAVENGVKISKNNRKRRNIAKKKRQLFMNENDYRLRLQEVLYNPDYIIQKIFRKDGPDLGVEFDSLPDNSFRCCNPGVNFDLDLFYWLFY